MQKKILMIDLQLFKGETTVTNTSTYTPTEYELQLQKIQADYAQSVAPVAQWLNQTAGNILKDSIGAVQVNFDNLNNQAQNQINAANQANMDLTNGILPQSYVDNMTQAIQSGVQNSFGNLLNNAANNGVVNSSVTSAGMNDISKNVADTMAQQYQSNIGLLNGINNNNITNATAGITAAAGAQEAAQNPALNLYNASLGLNSAGNSTLNALAGKGTTTSTQTQSGGSGGLLSGLVAGFF